MKQILNIILLTAITQIALAQSPMLDSAKNELARINKMFDSTTYLAFDVSIGYKNDSLDVTIEADSATGSYVLNKRNVYYKMGAAEYVQTDTFSYTIYNDEKLILMNRNDTPAGNSNMFNVRQFLDSVLNAYADSYSIIIDTVMTDSVNYYKRILFAANTLASLVDNEIPYKSFFVCYDEESYYPLQFAFSSDETVYVQDTIPSFQQTSYIISKSVTINFTNYSSFTNTDIFTDLKYAFYNRQRKIWEPADVYKGYQFVTSGFENEDPEAEMYREVPVDEN